MDREVIERRSMCSSPPSQVGTSRSTTAPVPRFPVCGWLMIRVTIHPLGCLARAGSTSPPAGVPSISAHRGHLTPTYTYWYLSARPRSAIAPRRRDHTPIVSTAAGVDWLPRRAPSAAPAAAPCMLPPRPCDAESRLGRHRQWRRVAADTLTSQRFRISPFGSVQAPGPTSADRGGAWPAAAAVGDRQ
jgi:hypothetical protein